jgi:hypothetical protein
MMGICGKLSCAEYIKYFKNYRLLRDYSDDDRMEESPQEIEVK